jgi:hypothetical protein
MGISNLEVETSIYKFWWVESWEASQKQEALVLPSENAALVHFFIGSAREPISKY